MALTTIDAGYKPLQKHTQAPPPPAVVTTPCDPWPRPYYLKDGLRRVHPYHFTYNTYCKERWRKREILDIFASEFRDRPVEYYVRTHDATGTSVAHIVSNTGPVETCHRNRHGNDQWRKDIGFSHGQERRRDITYTP